MEGGGREGGGREGGREGGRGQLNSMVSLSHYSN